MKKTGDNCASQLGESSVKKLKMVKTQQSKTLCKEIQGGQRLPC